MSLRSTQNLVFSTTGKKIGRNTKIMTGHSNGHPSKKITAMISHNFQVSDHAKLTKAWVIRSVDPSLVKTAPKTLGVGERNLQIQCFVFCVAHAVAAALRTVETFRQKSSSTSFPFAYAAFASCTISSMFSRMASLNSRTSIGCGRSQWSTVYCGSMTTWKRVLAAVSARGWRDRFAVRLRYRH